MTANEYRLEVTIWSAIGNTPITGRGWCYRDKLLSEVTTCTSPEDAFEYVKGLMKHTKHAAYADCYIPDYWNQNRRMQYISKCECV